MASEKLWQASNAPLLDPQAYKRRGNMAKWEELKTFFYDTKNAKVFGQKQQFWAIWVVFYTVFYTGLIVMLLCLMAIYLLSLDEIQPREQGMGFTPLKNSPGLAIRPQADFESPLIRFVQGRESSYQSYVQHLHAFLDQYERDKQDGENFYDCADGKPPELIQKVCVFDVNTFGDKCQIQTTFGFEEGKPCILLKLNKIFGWVADTFEQSEAPPEVGDRWERDHIGLSCHGESDADKENIGNISFYPESGFPRYFYPFLNQEGFRSPLVFAKFDNPSNGVLINVLCKAWARNIAHSYNDQIGLVRFSLLID